jgi:putative peptidoglycan lipid II flippase
MAPPSPGMTNQAGARQTPPFCQDIFEIAKRPPALAACRRMSLARNFTIVGGATLASRITGFGRDVLVAAVLGAGAVADAYVAAFLIPNLFRRLIGEGAFNTSYVPIFARRQAEGGKPSAEAFAETALSVFIGLGLAIVLLGELFMPWIIGAVAPGFQTNPEKLANAIDFGRIVFPFVAIILVVAVYSGTLNALGRYAAAAWAPVLLNILLIGALLFAIRMEMHGTREAGFILVWTIVGAAVLNLVIVAAATAFAGFRLVPARPRIDADIRRLVLIALPGIAIAGAGHLNVVIAAQMSSAIPSAVSWLYFAERIFQLPLGFVAAAIGVVLLPAIARHLAEGDAPAAATAQSRALEFALLIALPAAIALFVLAKPIVGILYERGAFGRDDTNAVAGALRALAVGLPAFVLVKVFLPAFLAREDMRAPLIAALTGIVANVLVAQALLAEHGHVAAAAGVAISAIGNAGMLWLLLIRDGHFRLDALGQRRLPRILLTVAVTAAVIVGFHLMLLPWLKAHQPFGLRVGVLAFVCVATVAVHAIVAQWMGAASLMAWRGALSRDLAR